MDYGQDYGARLEALKQASNDETMASGGAMLTADILARAKAYRDFLMGEPRLEAKPAKAKEGRAKGRLVLRKRSSGPH